MEAEAAFKRLFQEAEWPVEMPAFPLSAATAIVPLLLQTGMASSTSEAKRLLAQGGVSLRIGGPQGVPERVSDLGTIVQVPPDVEMRVGKRKFVRIVAP